MAPDKPVASADANGSDEADLAKVTLSRRLARDDEANIKSSGLPRTSQRRTDSDGIREPAHGNGGEDRTASGTGREGSGECGIYTGGADGYKWWREGIRKLLKYALRTGSFGLGSRITAHHERRDTQLCRQFMKTATCEIKRKTTNKATC